MLHTDTSTTSPLDWTYVAEGGDTIVLAYTGPSRSGLDQTVLRLKKCPRRQPVEEVVTGSLEPDRDFALRYQCEIVGRLLPAGLLPRYSTTQVTPLWLASVEKAVESKRPAQRSSETAVSPNQRQCLLATNLIAGHGVVVELKPKWGFLPSPVHLSSKTRENKLRHCRMCMHTQLKRMQGEQAAEGFCPLDLYSGDPLRMRQAILYLWKAWMTSKNNKILNLRVFFDGVTVDPRDPATVERMSKWLVAQSLGSATAEDAFVSMVMERLTSSSVLSVLSNLQRTLDPLDIEGLVKLASRSNQVLSLTQDVTLDEWHAFLREYEGPAINYDHSNPDVAHLNYYRLAYLLSATFKDCSIMVNLDDTVQEGRVAIIDLDPKPPNRFSKWENLDQQIAIEYEPDDSNSRCVDSLAPRQKQESSGLRNRPDSCSSLVRIKPELSRTRTGRSARLRMFGQIFLCRWPRIGSFPT